MQLTFQERLKHAVNAFMNRDPPKLSGDISIGGSYYRPDRARFTRGNERSMVAPIYNKIAMDCASIGFQHVKVDENGSFVESVDSELNRCLTVNANKDQTSRQFIQDAVMSLFDEGCIALPPIDTNVKLTSIQNGVRKEKYEILSIRTAKVLSWYPDEVRLRAYNDQKGEPQDFTMAKAAVPIIENPLYAVMNEQNSTVQRLIRTLNLSDTIDSQNGSGKLDMIIQLPYSIRTDAMKARAESRRADLEKQLMNNKYGIAYADSTEKIIQLNRGIENNLYERVKYLWDLLYSQLGLTEEILNGTANEATMQNYYSRSIEPVVSALSDAMTWKYLTEEQRANGEKIMLFRDPFKLVPVEKLADIADRFTRNEIMTPNEIRQIVGRKPVNDPNANELRNRNINSGEDQNFANTEEQPMEEPDVY